MTTKLDEQITNLLALAEKATPRPWVSPWDQPEDSGDLQNKIVGANGEEVIGVTYYDGPQLSASEDDCAYVIAAANLAPALAERVRVLERVARAGNMLIQFGMRHDDDCATRYDGECTCGLIAITSEFAQAWQAWQED